MFAEHPGSQDPGVKEGIPWMHHLVQWTVRRRLDGDSLRPGAVPGVQRDSSRRTRWRQREDWTQHEYRICPPGQGGEH